MVAAAHVVLIGLRHGELADWDQRSKWRKASIRKPLACGFIKLSTDTSVLQSDEGGRLRAEWINNMTTPAGV